MFVVDRHGKYQTIEEECDLFKVASERLPFYLVGRQLKTFQVNSNLS